MDKSSAVIREMACGETNARVGARRSRGAGFTLLEITVAMVILTIGLGGLGMFLASMTRQREQIEARTRVMSQAANLLEEIMSRTPGNIKLTYHGTTYSVDGIAGGNADGSALSVSAVHVTPKLLRVTVTALWFVREDPFTSILETEIYDPGG